VQIDHRGHASGRSAVASRALAARDLVKPALLVTTDVPADRVAPFRALHARRPIVVARFGATRRHAGAAAEDPGVPVLDVAQRDVLRHAASGRFGAVVAGTVGRVALPAAYAGARRARVPFVLWSALWSHPHVVSAPLMLALYRRADAVAAYGEHVAAFARRHGARDVHVAPQAVDPAFWNEPAGPRPADGFTALYVGRIEAEKGIGVLLDAWRRAALDPDRARLLLVGPYGDGAPPQAPPGATFTGPRTPEEVRALMAAASVLVLPSLATRAFREPWGLVANEALHQGLPVVASDAVGAAAGGLVRHERNGLVVAHGDAEALAGALRRLAADTPLRAQLGANGARDVAAFTPEAWAAGMAAAIDGALHRSLRS
jgi:glycosyltransferase involved in cell wall biosynthesis